MPCGIGSLQGVQARSLFGADKAKLEPDVSHSLADLWGNHRSTTLTISPIIFTRCTPALTTPQAPNLSTTFPLGPQSLHQRCGAGAAGFSHVGEAPPQADRRSHLSGASFDNNEPE